jgi:flavin-dependent dehydrogenase
MTEILDAVIVGAGPSGCCTATTLARAGRRVLLLDRDPEPRFKIGESLLPWNMPIFEEIGLLPKLHAAGFQPKYGAMFWNEMTGGVRDIVFRDSLPPRRPMAFQVQRVVFDGLFADHARECGAEVKRGVRVLEPIFEGDRAVGVRAEMPGGAVEDIRAKIVVDATGQAALLASRMKMRKGDPKLRRAALYAHWHGTWRADGERAGDILLPFLKDVWYWVIPFSDGSSSVGAVFEPSLIAGRSGSKEELYDELLARSPKMKEILAKGERKTPVAGTSDYSITADRFAGDGWVLVGDSATFLDPVFSTGVYLGTSAGFRAGKVIERALAARGSVVASDFRDYEKTTRRMVDLLKPFVYGYYDPVFTEAFCSEAPFDPMRAAVVSTLSGDVVNPSALVRFWRFAMLAAVEWLRVVRRFQPAPVAEQAG